MIEKKIANNWMRHACQDNGGWLFAPRQGSKASLCLLAHHYRKQSPCVQLKTCVHNCESLPCPEQIGLAIAWPVVQKLQQESNATLNAPFAIAFGQWCTAAAGKLCNIECSLCNCLASSAKVAAGKLCNIECSLHRSQCPKKEEGIAGDATESSLRLQEHIIMAHCALFFNAAGIPPPVPDITCLMWICSTPDQCA
eukprot:1160464-Pelagomonas_calceolata.AAC.9